MSARSRLESREELYESNEEISRLFEGEDEPPVRCPRCETRLCYDREGRPLPHGCWAGKP